MCRYFSIKEVAEIYGVSTKTVRRYISAGKLRAEKFGATWKISKSALDDFVAESTARGAPAKKT